MGWPFGVWVVQCISRELRSQEEEVYGEQRKIMKKIKREKLEGSMGSGLDVQEKGMGKGSRWSGQDEEKEEERGKRREKRKKKEKIK